MPCTCLEAVISLQHSTTSAHYALPGRLAAAGRAVAGGGAHEVVLRGRTEEEEGVEGSAAPSRRATILLLPNSAYILDDTAPAGNATYLLRSRSTGVRASREDATGKNTGTRRQTLCHCLLHGIVLARPVCLPHAFVSLRGGERSGIRRAQEGHSGAGISSPILRRKGDISSGAAAARRAGAGERTLTYYLRQTFNPSAGALPFSDSAALPLTWYIGPLYSLPISPPFWDCTEGFPC